MSAPSMTARLLSRFCECGLSTSAAFDLAAEVQKNPTEPAIILKCDFPGLEVIYGQIPRDATFGQLHYYLKHPDKAIELGKPSEGGGK